MIEFDVNTYCCSSPTSTFKWKIENFISCPLKSGQTLVTPQFECHRGSWKLILKFGKKDEEEDSKFKFYLKKNACEPPQNDVTFHMGLLDKHGILKFTSEYRQIFKNQEIYGCELIDGKELFGESRDELLPEGNLTLVCKITEHDWKFVHTSLTKMDTDDGEDTDIADEKHLFETMSQDFEKLFLSSEQSDVTLKAGNLSFKAHKTVLIARSPVFADMFRNCTEKENNIVEVSDISPFALQDTLQFMYTGKLKIITKVRAKTLYLAAKKYKMPDLESMCFKALFQPLSVDNFSEISRIAFADREEVLKEELSEFLTNHFKQILKTQHWNNFTNKHPNFAASILRSTLLKISNQSDLPKLSQ